VKTSNGVPLRMVGMKPRGLMPGLRTLIARDVRVFLTNPVLWVVVVLLPLFLIYLHHDALKVMLGAQDTLPESEGRLIPSPSQQIVIGTTLLFSGFLGATTSQRITLERDQGFWYRALTAPIPRFYLPLAVMLSTLILGTVQALAFFLLGNFNLGMELGQEGLGYLSFIPLVVGFLLVPIGLGLFTASLGYNTVTQGGIHITLAMLFGFFGGSLVPVFLLPDWGEFLSHFTPHFWAITGLHELMNGGGIADVLPNIGVLAAYSFIPLGLGFWNFKRRGWL